MSITTPASADDFSKWESSAKKMTICQLEYARKDCREASQAMRGWNPDREGYYADQGFTYADELRRRRAKGA